MKNYIVELEGCDASTYFNISLTDMERNFIIKLCRQANKSSLCGCEPRMYLYIDEGFNADTSDLYKYLRTENELSRVITENGELEV